MVLSIAMSTKWQAVYKGPSWGLLNTVLEWGPCFMNVVLFNPPDTLMRLVILSCSVLQMGSLRRGEAE